MASPFVQVLIGRLRRDVARSRHAEHRLATVLVPLRDDDRPVSAGGDVEGVAVARWELAAVARQLRHGHVAVAAWNQLVAHRVHGHGHAGSTIRNQVRRTGRRLAALVGHSAA